jgi:hypothetical protein
LTNVYQFGLQTRLFLLDSEAAKVGCPTAWKRNAAQQPVRMQSNAAAANE